MTDDGVGEAVLDELRRRKTDAELYDMGVDLFRMTSVYNGQEKVIIVDALRGGSEKPGSILVFSGEELTEKLDSRIRSAHMLGSIEALEILKRLNDDLAGADIHMVGIVAQTIDSGESLTPNVQEAVPKAADLIEKLLADSS